MKTKSDSCMDALWAKEAEDRLAAYRRGEIHAIALKEVLTKYAVKPVTTPQRRR
jgi:hypothetical protein